MRRFGIEVEARAPDPGQSDVPDAASEATTLSALFGGRLGRHSTAVVLYGLGWGIVNWGFVTFLPTILRDAGMQANASALLFYSALASIPGTAIVAYLYGRWSSRKSMIGFALLASASLAVFAVLGDNLARYGPALIVGLTALLMLSSTAVVSMLSPYAAEVYPTALRGRGSGLAAASSKLGGMIGPPVMGALLSGAGAAFLPAVVAAVPIGIAAVALIFIGEETRERSLEHISDPPVRAVTR